MISRRVHPFDVIARVLAERLRGRLPSAGLRDIVHSRGVDWERVVVYASAQFVLPAFAAALRDLGLTESLDRELGAFLDVGETSALRGGPPVPGREIGSMRRRLL